jgi:hypothetical protein
LIFSYSPKSLWSREFTRNKVTPPLVMGGRPPPPGWCPFQLNALKVSVKTKVKIKPPLLTVGNDIKSASELVLDRDTTGILLDFLNIRSPKFF